MNQILKYNVNRYLKRYYKFIFIGFILLIIIVILLDIKNTLINKNKSVYLKNYDTYTKIDEVYSKKDKDKKNQINNNEIYYGRIVIEKLNIDYMIFNNYSEEKLKILPCKYIETINNASIIGHNYENGIFFSNLKNIKINDEIKIIKDNNINKYKVSKIYEVEENNLSPIKNSKRPEITLITCNNFNKKRLIIKAKLVN